MSLTLSIFVATTSGAIESYYPDRYDASVFLKLINLWWIVSIGDTAVEGDNKTLYLGAFADWLERRQALQGQNSQKFTLSK